ncbi:MAG: sodium:alanine symporter family protein, partial [Prevotella sp.]|nr:sodium:alanine symporter family protein [Prevotella sp.]
MNELITSVNDVVWGYVLILALVGCGLWFTIRTRFVQFRMVGEMLRLLTDSAVDTVESQVKEKGDEGRRKHISSFQAFAVSVATRVGTGNLAGVASAIAIGGPGAVFWMWVIALIGSATAFVESTLAQLFKQKHKDSFIGGPAYYIQRGLHQRWMAITFAVLITCQFGLSNNSIQANTICRAMQEAFGWSPVWVGCILAALGLFIVFGGIQRIAHVSAVLVPVMAIGYVVLAVVIIVMNIDQVPHVFKVIVVDALGIQQVAGGGIGATIMNGVKRGLFSNEAGEGSAPNVAATAAVTHPVK